MSQSRIKVKKEKRSRSKITQPKYWIAVGALAAYTTLGSDSALKARAQEQAPTGGGSSPAQAKNLPAKRFDIPSGPLGTVLAAFQQDTGVNVVVPKDAISDIWSPGVSGFFTPDAALQRLLLGTGISFRMTASNEATLQIQGPSVAIEIQDSALQDTLPKFTQALVDTPQSIDVVPQKIMQDQNATTLRDALRNVAGISIAAGEGGAQGDSLTIRGFTARNDIFLDGMRDFGSYYRDPFNTQEVAVLQGPSSVTFGRGSTGGIVNQETKTPDLRSITGGDLDFGTDQTRRATFDVERALPMLGKGTAFRLNAMAHDSRIAGRDVGESRRAGIAPSLTFGLGTPTRLTLSYFHQSADDTPDYGIPWLFYRPAPVERRNYYGFQHGNYLKTQVDMGTAKLEHSVNNNITLRNQVRYANYNRDLRITEAQIGTTFDGDPVTPTTPLNDIRVNRNQIAVRSQETFLQDQADVTLRFKTGAFRHTLVSGVEIGHETSEPTRTRYDITGDLPTSVPKTSLLHPDTSERFSGVPVAANGTVINVSANSFGVYGVDTVNLAPRWDLTAGVRVDRFAADVVQLFPENIPDLHRTDVMPSWRTALVFKPASNGSIYFAYGTSFNPSAESLSLSVSSADVEPEENKTIEVGSKWDLFSRKLSFRSAFFQTTKLNAREQVSPTEIQLAGKQRVTGFQFQSVSHLSNRWDILASYAYMQSRELESLVFPNAVGYPLANVPKNTFSIWSSYDLPWRLAIGGGADYVGSRSASSTVPLDPTTGLLKQAPDYVVFNAMLRYPLTERINLQANIYNLTDKYYYDQIHPAHIVPGAARSGVLSLNYRF